MATKDDLAALIAAEIGKPENLEHVAETTAAGLILSAWHTLREAGEDSRAALSMAGYLVLRSVYGRDFVRAELGLSARTERRYAERVREVAEQLGAEPSRELLELAVRGGFAALRNPDRD